MPTVTAPESSRHENVITNDDVVLSSTQLSKSIDKLDGDSHRRRSTFTSVPTFPCCQVRFKAHGNSTFPLYFDNNLLVDHFENISMHDLLKVIKKSIKDEGNINNNTLPLMGKEFGRDQQRWIKRDQWFGDKDKWSTNRATQLSLCNNFPTKSKETKAHRINSFPCSRFDFQQSFGLQNGMPCDNQSFPLTLKCEKFKFPFYIAKAKDYQYNHNTNMKNMQNIKKSNSNKVQKIFEDKEARDYQCNSLNIIKHKRGCDITATQFEWCRFPLKKQMKRDIDNKFPLFTFRQVDLNINQMENKSFVKTINIKRSAQLETKEEMENSVVTLISHTPGQPKTEQFIHNTTTFPIKAKGIKDKFPLQDNIQQPTRSFKRLQKKFISKSLQDMTPKSYINILNKPNSKFPLKTKSMHKTFKQFPLKSMEPFAPYLILNELKTKTFPLTSQENKSKFPYKNIPKEINLNLTVKKMRQKLHLNNVNKTLRLTRTRNFNTSNYEYHKTQVNLGANNKFPLKYLKANLDIGNRLRYPLKETNLSFPLNQFSLTNHNFHKTETKQFSSFPLKFHQNFGNFPFEHKPREFIINLSVHEVKKKLQSNRISKFLKTTQNLYEIANSKSFTKFPLKDRLVKKFYRIFPSEKDITTPHGAIGLWKDSTNCIRQQQSHFTNFANHNATLRNNANIFKITTTTGAVPSMTPDLYKQRWSFCQQRNTTDDDNEKHASQVQFTQQVHVENPVGTPPTIPRPPQTPSTHNENDNDNDFNILPAIDTKNISLTTTKTATEVGQYSENFEHHDAIINIRGDNDDVSLSSGATLSQNIINSSFNYRHYNEDEHEHERECDVGSTLRASTPPMSAITSVQNTERLVVLHDHDVGGDLCNPQVAQIVECSSDVRDTFSTTVDNGSRTNLNFNITGSILDTNQNESSSPPTHIPAPSSLTPSTCPPPLSNLITFNVASISDRICSTSLEGNYTNFSEILPKYSVPELSESNAINCSEIDCTEIRGVTDQPSRQSSEKERVVAVSYETTNDQGEVTNINEIFKYCTNDEQSIPLKSLDNLEIDEINDLEIIDDLIQIDEMKFEMKSSKGALPSTTSATARSIGKPIETGVSSFNRSKPYATTASLRGPSDRVASTVPVNDHSSIGIRGSRDRISSTAPTNSTSRPTATRRLSNDYSSVPAGSTYSIPPRTISSIPTSSASQRTSSNLTSPRSSLSTNYSSEGAKASPASFVTNRYTNDNIMAVTPAPTPNPKLKYTRRPTSGALLSLDLPRYTSSAESLTDSSATINRGVSLDITSASDVLPERTRLRRQRRFRPKDSQDEDEDPTERLNRLKARISASLSEVKGVLKQYSTEAEGENETQTSDTLAPSAVSSLTLGELKEDDTAEEKEEEGPVTFRFVKKIRRRSFFTEDDDAEQEAGKDEVDKSQSVPYLQKDTDKIKKLPQATDEIPQEFKNQEYKSQSNVASNLSTKPGLNDIQSQDIGPTPRSSQKSDLLIMESQKDIPTGAEYQKAGIQNVSTKSNVTGNILPQNSQLEFNKPPSAGEQNHVEQLVDIKMKDMKNDFKVNESQTGNTESNVLSKPEMQVDNEVSDKSDKLTKKVQNTKVKANKNGSQHREMKTGKLASKIPQRIEKKTVNNMNDTKMETKTNISGKKTENNDSFNEIRTSEIPRNENFKDISAKPAEVEIKKSHTVEKHQVIQDVPSNLHDVTFNDISNKEVSPKPVVTDNKAQDKEREKTDTKELTPQTTNQLETKVKDLKIDKDIKESSPKPTKLAIEVKNEKPIITKEIGRTKDLSPKPNVSKFKSSDTENKTETKINMENHKDASSLQPTSSMAGALKPLIQIEATAIHEPKVIDEKQSQMAFSDLSEKETTNEASVRLREIVSTKSKDPLRRTSLAAVEASKIEPPVKIATPGKIQRRPSDSEAIVKKKLITTKTTTSGSVGEVTPKPKIVKVKRSSVKKPISPSTNSNDTRHQLARTQAETIATNNRNGQRIKEVASLSSTEANKSIQGDKNKDVRMPNDEMLTQMPPQLPANDTKSLDGKINRTQLLINEAATNHPPSSSLSRKAIELDALASQATIDNATATTTKLAASKIENSDGGAMLANSKPTVVSSTTTSAASSPKQTIKIPPQEDLYDLLQREAVIFVQPAKKDPNELNADENNKVEGTDKNLTAHNATPANLEASDKQFNEPSEIPKQQQVAKTTDIEVIKSNDDSVQVIATPHQQSSTSIDNANIVSTASSSPVGQHTTTLSVTANQQTQQKQQQQSPTTTTTTIEDATTKTSDSPQISISSQEATTEDTHSKAATQTTSIPEATLQVESKGLEGVLLKMPELQQAPAPVQTAEIPHETHKKNVIIKKAIRQKSGENVKKADEKISPIEESVIPEIILDQLKDEAATASANEDLSETPELSTEESSSQSEAGAEATRPKKVRKAKKKVIIKRQKRRLSISGDSFFNKDSIDEPVNAEVETLEKPISFVSDEEQEDEPVVEEKKPLKSCISKKEHEIGDEVLYGERIKRTQIKWRRGRVKERTSNISYLLDIDGTEVSSHVNYLKKYTSRKVNFGTKEYLEIDYEQLAEDEERAERVKQRTFSIWNMV